MNMKTLSEANLLKVKIDALNNGIKIINEILKNKDSISIIRTLEDVNVSIRELLVNNICEKAIMLTINELTKKLEEIKKILKEI